MMAKVKPAVEPLKDDLTCPYLPPPEDTKPDISNIQCKTDNSFIVDFNGLPFHATQTDTPDVYQLVLNAIKDGQTTTQYPEAMPAPVDLEVLERAWRDIELESVKWLRERHRDEQDIESATSLNDEQFRALLDYIQALRQWPQTPEFPATERRPVRPDWIVKESL